MEALPPTVPASLPPAHQQHTNVLHCLHPGCSCCVAMYTLSAPRVKPVSIDQGFNSLWPEGLVAPPPPAAVLSTLEERLDGVANGSLTMTISSLSVTPARQAVVQFIK